MLKYAKIAYFALRMTLVWGFYLKLDPDQDLKLIKILIIFGQN